ncbi:MAG: 50S ribosomal protein L31e [Candidatus Woesearchaeota archaeon]
MAEERVYNIPLRKEFLKVPKYKRSKKAVTAVKEFLARHMKSSEVRLGRYINETIWSRGIKNPPHHIKVHCIKDEKGVVRAEIVGKDILTDKKEKEKSAGEKLRSGGDKKRGIEKETTTNEKNTNETNKSEEGDKQQPNMDIEKNQDKSSLSDTKKDLTSEKKSTKNKGVKKEIIQNKETKKEDIAKIRDKTRRAMNEKTNPHREK